MYKVKKLLKRFMPATFNKIESERSLILSELRKQPIGKGGLNAKTDIQDAAVLNGIDKIYDVLVHQFLWRIPADRMQDGESGLALNFEALERQSLFLESTLTEIKEQLLLYNVQLQELRSENSALKNRYRDESANIELSCEASMIPVVYAIDDDHINSAIVSIASLLGSADRETGYFLHFLVPGAFSEQSKGKLIQLIQMYTNAKAVFYNMNEYYTPLFERASTCDFYKLKTAEILLEVQKCIFLETETVMSGDLSALYAMDLEEDCLRTVGDNRVLLMSLENMRKDNIKNAVDTCLERNYVNSQAVLNKACEGRISCIGEEADVVRSFCR